MTKKKFHKKKLFLFHFFMLISETAKWIILIRTYYFNICISMYNVPMFVYALINFMSDVEISVSLL